jgi:hypothetical protein
MNGLPPERKERLLIRLIGAAILLIVLAIAYLTYRSLPASDPDPTVHPASTSAPADTGGGPAAPATRDEDSTSAAPQPEPDHESAAPPAKGSPQDDPAS